MKINLWYSKSMQQWRWTLSEEFKNGVTKLEQHSGQRIYLRDAMEDVANTVEYIIDKKKMNPLSQYKEGGLPVEQPNLLRLISELEGSSQLCKWMGFIDDMETLDKIKKKYYTMYFRLKKEQRIPQ